jgi:hypothetical protein
MIHPWRIPGDAWLNPAWNAALDAATSAANEAGPEAAADVLAGLAEAENGTGGDAPEEVDELHSAARP